MDQENDQLLTKLSVRLVNLDSDQTIGSGIIYSNPSLQNEVYVLTAAHCLYEDADNFEKALEKIGIYLFNSFKNTYECINHIINYDLVWAQIEKDAAILVLKLDEVETVIGKLPIVNVVTDRHDHLEFLAKGFPSATNGKELVSINPTWAQELSDKNQFQLHLNQDFSDAYSSVYRVDGFSGAGIFLYSNQQIYLYGIFTRFRDSGKIIYCQTMANFTILLATNYLAPFSYTYFGKHGVSADFFHRNASRAISELGPRFSSDLNFQLPIARYFNAITKDNIFRQELTKIVDRQLSKSIYSNAGSEIIEIDNQYNGINVEIKNWYNKISWDSADTIDITSIIEQINFFEENALKKSEELYVKRSQENSRKIKNNLDSQPYETDISHLRNLRHSLSDFKDDIISSNINLSNYPVLLIKGNAGSGKSHLLGDILQKRNQNNLPSLLLLGQLFVTGKTIWENVLIQLGLKCSQQEFLSTLNKIGEQIGSRVLIMVDAINEGAGKELWRNGLAGFIHDFNEYPNIGLVISIRTTYWRLIVPENIQNNQYTTIIEHQGFRGNEYEAVKLFCEFYNLKQPNFPLLNPEYSNPLFLHLICKGIQGSKQQAFPQGFQGITKVFNFYLKAVLQRLILKREIYDYAPMLLINALNSFAKICFEKEQRSLKLSDALTLFEKEFSRYPNLLGDLIEESVLVRSLPERYGWEDQNDDEEIVYFAYERFGDFYLAGELIKDFNNNKDLLDNFKKDKPLGKLIEYGGWSNSGILEALAVLLPEKYGLEIFEVFGWVYKLEEKFNYSVDSIPYWFLNSLKWRTPESIDDEKFVLWAQERKRFIINEHEYYNFLFEMCAVEGHPFNSDRLTRIFMKYSMAERDSFLQRFFLYYSGKDDSGTAMPIQRLIDWAWRPNISVETSNSSAILVGQALIWILTSTATALRDRTTKALVNLLQNQFSALLTLFNRFIDIDDLYISERLCAIAYGCALRSKDSEKIKILAQTVYDKIFRNGNPPTHLFLRDYCRHIIEFSLSKGIPLDLSGANYKPPYNALLPTKYPIKEELDIFTKEKDKNGKKGIGARSNQKLIFSVISWDFGRYTIESAVRHFDPVPFRFEEEEKLFRKTIERGGKSFFDSLKKFYYLYASPPVERKRNTFLSEERRIEFWNSVDEVWLNLEEKLLSKLGDEQKVFYREKIIPYWELILKSKKTRDLRLEHEKIKVWIAKRAFELGYDGNIHGSFDDYHDTYDRSDEAKVERIGKKYQWIAYYEVLGVLADNYKIRELYSDNKKSWIYNGSWDLTYRDIDPSFITKRDREKYDDEDFGLVKEDTEWYFPQKYLHWNNLKDNWAVTTADLPSLEDNIVRTDPQGNQWLYLHSSYTWKAPKLVGENSYRSGRKEIWYMFQSFIVPNNRNYDRIIKWLCNQEFNGRWLPESYEVSNLLARESYWSPLSKIYQKDHGFKRKLEDTNYTVALPVVEAIGSLDKDRSGAHFWYKIPNKEIFEALDLRYSDKDGDLEDCNGKVLFTNSPLGCLIKKDILQKYLDENNLRIIWTLLGEKNSFYDRGHTGDIRKSISGVVELENNDLKRISLKVIDW